MITIRMSLLRGMMHARHHIHKKLSSAKVNKRMMFTLLLISIQFLLLKEFSRNVKEEAKCNTRSNGSAIPKINRPGNRRKIFWINVFEKFEHGLRRDRQKNLVYSMFESQFTICFSLCNVVSARPSNLNQQINCVFLPHDKPDSSFVTFIDLSRGSDFVLSDNERWI